MADAASLVHLFDRPMEPMFLPKGDKGEILFEIPASYIKDRYRDIAWNKIANRSKGQAGILVEEVKEMPDLDFPKLLGRRDQFSVFIPRHQEMAAVLIQAFMDQKTIDDLLSLAVYCRDHMNPYLFNYAYTVALMHREDTKHLELPSVSEIFPDKFMPSQVFRQAKEESHIVKDEIDRVPIIVERNYSASDLEEEHRVAYFREDLGINLHHWHWHLVYPFSGPKNIVAKDRRGELFFYMHQQMQARYNFERFSNNLLRVKRLCNLREPLKEGYFPKLSILMANRTWPCRNSNAILQDVHRETDNMMFDLNDLDMWRDRILAAACSKTYVNENGVTMKLTEETGIDILGNMLESSILSPNKDLYGEYHNMGHSAIMLNHDPEQKFMEGFGIMGDTAVAMRDPAFYRWHANINDFYEKFKRVLQPYPVSRLAFPGVTIQSIEVVHQGGELNHFNTFWQESDVNLSRGLDFHPRGQVLARITHLNHDSFQYKITVNSNGRKKGTVRIFLGPKFDEAGKPFPLDVLRTMMIEMDKFVVNLKSGRQTIKRESIESSITIPFERTFRDLNTNRPPPTKPGELLRFNMCGCGWPQHMLIPKGTFEGLDAILFVMISDYNNDKVDELFPEPDCSEASSFCGVRDRKYPDKQPMGFPFDRPARDKIPVLSRFMTPNMAQQEVKIHYNNKTVKKEDRKMYNR